MIAITVNGNTCQIERRGTVKEVSQDYFKVIMTVIESISEGAGVTSKDVLTFLYDILCDIYDDDETVIKT